MIFEKWLVPDRIFGHYYEITPDMVRSMGRSVLLCDIDNTLATYDDPLPPAKLTEWIEKMRRSGISIAFVSNNNKERVELFNEPLGCVAFAEAGKPGTKYLAVTGVQTCALPICCSFGRSASHRLRGRETVWYSCVDCSADPRQENSVLSVKTFTRETVFAQIPADP